MTLVSNAFTKPSHLNDNLNLDLDPNYLVNNETPVPLDRKISETKNAELSNFINKVNLFQQREKFKHILCLSVFIISTFIFSSLFFYFEYQTRLQTIFIPQTKDSVSQANKA